MKLLITLLTAAFLNGCSFHVKNVTPASPYDFAQLHQMAKYAQAAYTNPVGARAVLQPAFPDVSIQIISATNNQYYIATSTAAQVQLIAIAGTANIENVLLDADQTREFIPSLNISLHRGFAKAARLIYEDVKPRLKPGYHVWLTGHSLGGAEAVILGMELQAAGTPAERIITFGQPKVTNSAGVAAFKTLPLTRVINQKDLVPDLPLNPYRHIGPELVLFVGTDYSVVESRPLDPAALAAASQALQNHQLPNEFPDHYIANYILNLESKSTASRRIPFPAP